MKSTPLSISLETTERKDLYFHSFGGEKKGEKPIVRSKMLRKLYYVKAAASKKVALNFTCFVGVPCFSSRNTF